MRESNASVSRAISRAVTKSYTRRISILIVLFAASASTAAAAPWTRPAGETFVATRLDAFRARGEAGDTFERLDAGLYAEHGVFASTMIGTKIIYGSARSAGPGFENTASGIVEVEGFAQRTIASGAFGVVSARTAIARPASLAAGARPGLAADGVDLEARALYGIGFGGPVAGFFSLEAAYRGRTGLAADQARFDAILGFEPHQDFLLMAEAQTAFSVGDPRPGGADFDVVKLQPSIVWRANSKFALRAGGLIEVASRNLTPGRGVFISFWSEF